VSADAESVAKLDADHATESMHEELQHDLQTEIQHNPSVGQAAAQMAAFEKQTVNSALDNNNHWLGQGDYVAAGFIEHEGPALQDAYSLE